MPQINQFSKNLFVEMKGKVWKIFNKNKVLIGEAQLSGDEEIGSMIWNQTMISPELMQDEILEELLFNIIMEMSKHRGKQFSIQGISVKECVYNKIINKILIMYDNHIVFSPNIKINKPIDNVQGEISNPERTHYVPQTYLRNFSSNWKLWKKSRKYKKARVFCFDKFEGNFKNEGNTPNEINYGPRIESIGWKGEFYSLFMEYYLRFKIEKPGALIIRKILSCKSISTLSEKERQSLIRFIIIQRERTDDVREDTGETFIKGMEQGANIFLKMTNRESAIGKFRVTMSDSYARILHENQMLSMIHPINGFDLVKYLVSLEWRLIDAKSPYFFLTSDHPVILNNTFHKGIVQQQGKDKFLKDHKQRRENQIKGQRGDPYIFVNSGLETGRAFAMQGIEIYLPLSPYWCLCIMDSPRAKKPLSIGGINRESILQSHRYVFSHSNDVQFVKRIIICNPTCADAGRKTTSSKVELEFIGDNENKS